MAFCVDPKSKELWGNTHEHIVGQWICGSGSWSYWALRRLIFCDLTYDLNGYVSSEPYVLSHNGVSEHMRHTVLVLPVHKNESQWTKTSLSIPNEMLYFHGPLFFFWRALFFRLNHLFTTLLRLSHLYLSLCFLTCMDNFFLLLSFHVFAMPLTLMCLHCRVAMFIPGMYRLDWLSSIIWDGLTCMQLVCVFPHPLTLESLGSPLTASSTFFGISLLLFLLMGHHCSFIKKTMGQSVILKAAELPQKVVKP